MWGPAYSSALPPQGCSWLCVPSPPAGPLSLGSDDDQRQRGLPCALWGSTRHLIVIASAQCLWDRMLLEFLKGADAWMAPRMDGCWGFWGVRRRRMLIELSLNNNWIIIIILRGQNLNNNWILSHSFYKCRWSAYSVCIIPHQNLLLYTSKIWFFSEVKISDGFVVVRFSSFYLCTTIR